MSRDVVRVLARGGTWETIGADRWRGIVPEGIIATADTGGPKTLGFTLKRDLGVPWGDLEQLTDAEYYRDGVLVWGGAIQDAPTDASSRTAAVTAIGGRAMADLAPVTRIYVDSRMSDWKDARQCPTNIQTGTRPALAATGFGGRGTVNVTDGMISIGWAGSVGTVPTSDAVGVYFDATDAARITGVYIAWESYGSNAFGAAPRIYLRGCDAPPFLGDGYEVGDAISGITWNVSQTNTGTRYTFARGARYVTLFLYMSSATASSGADAFLRVLDLRVFTSSAYVGSAGTFDLKADAVAKELAASGSIQAVQASDVSQIDPAAFGIPHLTSDGYAAPSTIMDKAYGYEDAFWGIDERRRVFAKNRPASPRFTITNLSSFRDASGISGVEAYNGVIVTGADALGNPLAVRRHAAQGLTSFPWRVGAVQPTNPSFAVDLSGWTLIDTVGTVTRDTSVFDTTPASAKISGGAASVYYPLAGLTIGHYYRARARMRVDAAARTQGTRFTVLAYGSAFQSTLFLEDGYGSSKTIPAANGAWEDVWVDFVAPEASIVLWFDIQSNGTGVANLDTVEMWEADTGTLDRRGLLRAALLQSNAALTVAGASQLGDLWLRLHTSAPFKGSVRVGLGDVHEYTSGRPVPMGELLLGLGEYAHFAGLRDPDTGALGRDGLIVGVSFNADDDTVDLEVDNERSSFDKLLSRVGALQTFASL